MGHVAELMELARDSKVPWFQQEKIIELATNIISFTDAQAELFLLLSNVPDMAENADAAGDGLNRVLYWYDLNQDAKADVVCLFMIWIGMNKEQAGYFDEIMHILSKPELA